MEKPFREIRLHRDKPPQEFICSLLYQEKNYVVLSYISNCPYNLNGIHIKQGSTTIAHYWKGINYVLWKIKDPDMTLKGYLFHISKNTEIERDNVRFEDLELDIWFYPDGNTVLLDQEEVNKCANRGLINAEEISLIEQQKEYILDNFHDIVTDTWSEESAP